MGVHRSPPQPRKLVQRLETEICRCLRNGEKARVEGGAESWSWKPWVAPWVLVRPLAYSWLKWDSHGREESRNVMLFVRSGALDAVRRENCGRGWWKPSPDRKQLKPSSQNGGVLQRDVTRDLGEAAASRKITNKQNLLLYCCQMVGDKKNKIRIREASLILGMFCLLVTYREYVIGLVCVYICMFLCIHIHLRVHILFKVFPI